MKGTSGEIKMCGNVLKEEENNRNVGDGQGGGNLGKARMCGPAKVTKNDGPIWRKIETYLLL